MTDKPTPEYNTLVRYLLSVGGISGIARCNLSHIGSSTAAAEQLIAEGQAHWVPNEQDPDNRDVDALRWTAARFYLSPIPDDENIKCTMCGKRADHYDDDSLPYCSDPTHNSVTRENA